MRTSFDLDDDLADKLKKLAHKKGASLRKVLNEVLRAGLSKQAPRIKHKPFRVDTFRSSFQSGIDPFRLNQLNDELEIERFLGQK